MKLAELSCTYLVFLEGEAQWSGAYTNGDSKLFRHMDKLNIWTPIIVTLVSGLLGQPIIQLIISYQKRRLKNLLNVIETKGFIDQCNEDFKSKFVIPDFQENYFFVQTGIKTNHKSINLYIQLKDNLGNNFTWDRIREAKPHLRFINEKLVISVNKWERLYKNANLIVGLMLFLFGFATEVYFSQYVVKTLNEVFMLLFMIVIPFGFGFILVTSVQSLISATIIEKRLRGLLETKAKPAANNCEASKDDHEN